MQSGVDISMSSDAHLVCEVEVCQLISTFTWYETTERVLKKVTHVISPTFVVIYAQQVLCFASSSYIHLLCHLQNCRMASCLAYIKWLLYWYCYLVIFKTADCSKQLLSFASSSYIHLPCHLQNYIMPSSLAYIKWLLYWYWCLVIFRTAEYSKLPTNLCSISIWWDWILSPYCTMDEIRTQQSGEK
jgi:hypothetical protein